jgi:hypothetical protein
MSCSCTLVFHARPATIFLGDGAFQVLLSLAVLMGQRNTRSARLLAGVLMSRPRSVGRMVTFALRKRSTCSAWRNVVKLNSLEEGRRITGGTFYPTTAFMEFRLEGNIQRPYCFLPTGTSEYVKWILHCGHFRTQRTIALSPRLLLGRARDCLAKVSEQVESATGGCWHNS